MSKPKYLDTNKDFFEIDKSFETLEDFIVNESV